jgi:hypothetical protein
MKRILITLLFISTGIIAVQAQQLTAPFSGTKMQKIIDTRFTPALRNDCQGIVEGAIYNLIVCKRLYPELDFSSAAELMKNVSIENEAAAMRYKAYLGITYLSDAEGIEITPVSDQETYDYLFKQIAVALQEKLLVTNTGLE